ncbi:MULTISPECIES: hypothetical protein [Dictyoglomus]|uniref:Uncharacterized protein n=1 Tax=Dictyoglomus turgidum (strain DSM 6724 / Z-1310) TaxID=515635 RepID=B8DZ02_DICTD|nr:MULTISPECIES: hypothetical protein [Dictyoglomus]ACK41628.1 conserved hypothetical protein [Dictyoglomus turgidum DSM 6724]HBU32013.1 hypothetical protein [Dictyoglomus sp.]
MRNILKLKKTTIVIIAVFLLFSLYSSKSFGFDWDSFLEGLYRCNITFQRPIYGDTYLYNDPLSTSFTVIDVFGDDYTFYINQNANSSKISYLSLNIRIPFFYTDSLSIGFSNSQRYFYTNIFNETGFSTDSILMANGGGLYLNLKATNQLCIFTVLGAVYYEIDSVADTLKPSWYGDPGLYWNGYFYEPGTPLKVKGQTDYMFFFSVGIKYYLLSGLYLELCYSNFPGATIKNMSYILEGPTDLKINVSSDKMPKPITIKESSIITFGIGLGL